MKNQSLIYCMGHGVGVVVDKSERSIGEDKLSFINAKIVANGLTLMLPEKNKNKQFRKLLKKEDISGLYSFMKERSYDADNSTWNRRNRDYLLRIKSLNHLEVASVLRDIMVLSKKKKLSFGERRMKDQVLDLLSHEIHYVTKNSIEDIKKNLEA